MTQGNEEIREMGMRRPKCFRDVICELPYLIEETLQIALPQGQTGHRVRRRPIQEVIPVIIVLHSYVLFWKLEAVGQKQDVAVDGTQKHLLRASSLPVCK